MPDYIPDRLQYIYLIVYLWLLGGLFVRVYRNIHALFIMTSVGNVLALSVAYERFLLLIITHLAIRILSKNCKIEIEKDDNLILRI